MNNRFEVGDHVVCINNKTFSSSISLIENSKIYKIEAINSMGYIKINDVFYCSTRFICVKKTTSKMSTKFEPIDYSRVEKLVNDKNKSNIYYLRPNQSLNQQMHIFYASLESRGVPKVLFNGYINGLNIEINNQQTKTVINDGLTLASEIEWKVFIELHNHGIGVTKMKPLFGAHSDFEE